MKSLEYTRLARKLAWLICLLGVLMLAFGGLAMANALTSRYASALPALMPGSFGGACARASPIVTRPSARCRWSCGSTRLFARTSGRAPSRFFIHRRVRRFGAAYASRRNMPAPAVIPAAYPQPRPGWKRPRARMTQPTTPIAIAAIAAEKTGIAAPERAGRADVLSAAAPRLARCSWFFAARDGPGLTW